MSIILYAHPGYQGRELTLESSSSDLRTSNFNDKVSSFKVQSGTWKLWERINFSGRCYKVGPGDYDITLIEEKIGNAIISSVELLYKIKLYEHPRYEGRELVLESSSSDLRRSNFNDKAFSIKVWSGMWTLWEHINFSGRWFKVGPGHYDIGLIRRMIGNDFISSVELLPKISLCEYAGFEGREFAFGSSTGDLGISSSIKGSSVIVWSGAWKLWERVNFTGRCYQVNPGEYDTELIEEKIGKNFVSSVELFSKIVLYEHARFEGRELTLESSTSDIRSSNFNDKVSSVTVWSGIWKLWEHVNFTGKCYQVGPGQYDIELIKEKIGNVISSVEKL